MTEPNQIIYPVLALVTLKFMVASILLWRRIKAVSSGMVAFSFYQVFRSTSGTIEPASLIQVSRNYSNLYEAPLLFYVVTLWFYFTASISGAVLFCAWGYVVMRYLHSLIHLGGNNVQARLVTFLASQVFLLVLWIQLALWLCKQTSFIQ